MEYCTVDGTTAYGIHNSRKRTNVEVMLDNANAVRNGGPTSFELWADENIWN